MCTQTLTVNKQTHTYRHVPQRLLSVTCTVSVFVRPLNLQSWMSSTVAACLSLKSRCLEGCDFNSIPYFRIEPCYWLLIVSHFCQTEPLNISLLCFFCLSSWWASSLHEPLATKYCPRATLMATKAELTVNILGMWLICDVSFIVLSVPISSTRPVTFCTIGPGHIVRIKVLLKCFSGNWNCSLQSILLQDWDIPL